MASICACRISATASLARFATNLLVPRSANLREGTDCELLLWVQNAKPSHGHWTSRRQIRGFVSGPMLLTSESACGRTQHMLHRASKHSRMVGAENIGRNLSSLPFLVRIFAVLFSSPRIRLFPRRNDREFPILVGAFPLYSNAGEDRRIDSRRRDTSVVFAHKADLFVGVHWSFPPIIADRNHTDRCFIGWR